ncbi:hypothetical protein CGH02_23800 [Vibrio parahaemolyticus]|uniref:hypothetical protein n=1 Tax=Vibrio parahaemolyticus TaxID=670 RepID=UPI0011209665|nr:hypothetical protein [Vibrio parahaemolyticus]MDF4592794.1 hypothetical protein [Vibrio parahaemolyticus]TOH97793.1 hypothetical protein CGI69_23300 [Vibrio parahaemolyticus]TOJ33788.1 hypothetical protein CGI40_23740 [Vibrio parahaemolyticus]TOJ38509.1 hypothetical protein CGI39_23730 [Vibrio parahaemolyticus]TOJ57012.1 hypothetical protein CGI36_23815 [Vibrio parahaemolyticus]
MSNFEYQLYCKTCCKVTPHKRQILNRTEPSENRSIGVAAKLRLFFNLCTGEPLDKRLAEESADTCTICGKLFNRSSGLPDFLGQDDD